MHDLKNPREVSYLALVYAKDGKYADSYFSEKELLLSHKDLKLSKEISYGVLKRKLSLEYLSLLITNKNKLGVLKLKRKEKYLLYSAIYQYFFMDRVPVFAIVNETVAIAKKYFGKAKSTFFNMFLRKMDKTELSLPLGKSIKDLSIFYSYPDYFISELIQEYGNDETTDILKTQNRVFPPMLRIREGDITDNCTLVHSNKYKMATITGGDISTFCGDSRFYIQNITPILLLEAMVDVDLNPLSILDLCASPGGKIIALHDIFPEASLFVNDLSSSRLRILSENFQKYGIEATVYNEAAEKIQIDKKFDLIILDVPCSNSGVLGKRHEARWRIDEPSLLQLNELQHQITENANHLLSSNGYIIYMTCSILRKENEDLIDKIISSTGLTLIKSCKILPDNLGKDGGYAAILQRK